MSDDDQVAGHPARAIAGDSRDGRGGRWTLFAALGAVAALALTLVVVLRPDRDDQMVNGTATTASTAPTRSTSSLPPVRTVPSTSPAPSATSGPASSGPTSVPATSAPTVVGPGRVISRVDTDRRVVALTFDAGSDLGHTAQILGILTANGIRATFGITGRFAQDHPATVRRIAAEGHQIVNHSYDHPSFTGTSTDGVALSAAQRTDQLRRAEAAIIAATGGGTAGWFRPPYGDIDDSVVHDATAAGWNTILLWTVDSLGWQGPGADAVARRCLERAEPGAIYLFHVGEESDDTAALQWIIDGLRADGYGFDSTARLVRATP